MKDLVVDGRNQILYYQRRCHLYSSLHLCCPWREGMIPVSCQSYIANPTTSSVFQFFSFEREHLDIGPQGWYPEDNMEVLPFLKILPPVGSNRADY